MDVNQKFWQSKKIANFYSTRNYLQKPEDFIKNKLAQNKDLSKMLDIGVGGGRTTRHFGKMFSEYVGIDYSNAMVDLCNNEFKSYSNFSFEFKDVRSYNFENQSFDFVLFSYNGIDYMNDVDRMKTLKNIKNALTPEGIFAFSSHNLNSIKALYQLNSLKSKDLISWVLFIISNKSRKNILRHNWAIIKDGYLNFKLKTYYIKPLAQRKILLSLGFKQIKIIDKNGDVILLDEEIKKNTDPWLYFMCTK